MRLLVCFIVLIYLVITGCDPEKEFNPANPVLSQTVPHPFNKFHLRYLGGTVVDQASEKRFNLSGTYMAYQPTMSFEGNICVEQSTASINYTCQGNPSSQNFQIILNQNQTQATFSGRWGPLLQVEGVAAETRNGLSLRFNNNNHQNYEAELSVISE